MKEEVLLLDSVMSIKYKQLLHFWHEEKIFFKKIDKVKKNCMKVKTL